MSSSESVDYITVGLFLSNFFKLLCFAEILMFLTKNHLLFISQQNIGLCDCNQI